MRIGVLGGGQLGWMLALAGYPLGFYFSFLDPAPESPVERLAPRTTERYDDFEALERFVSNLDLVTYEFGNVPVAAARFLQERVPVFPPPLALEVCQDRLNEKDLFGRLEIPVPTYAAVENREGLEQSLEETGFPAVLKTRRLGYDGKGQFVLRKPNDVVPAWDALGGSSLLLEAFVPFDRELSILAVRGRGGEIAYYPLVENRHEGGILRLSQAPAVGPDLSPLAERYAVRVLEALDYVGVLAIEFFEAGGRLLANEMAPRVHNSGHWTIDGAETSQFENHLRAITGLPLGSTAAAGYSAMFNLIGTLPDPSSVLEIPGAHLHIYGKEPRPGRKLGHVTLHASGESIVAERAEQLRSRVDGLPFAPLLRPTCD